jgi:hypothetical protein
MSMAGLVVAACQVRVKRVSETSLRIEGKRKGEKEEMKEKGRWWKDKGVKNKPPRN